MPRLTPLPCLLLGDRRSYENMTNAQQIMAKVERLACGPDGSISRNEFCEFIGRYPALLYPAHELQLRMQKKMGGVKFWEKTSKRRCVTVTAARACLPVVATSLCHCCSLRRRRPVARPPFPSAPNSMEKFANIETLNDFVKHARETVRVSFRKTPKGEAALLYPKSELEKRAKREERMKLAKLSTSERARRRSAADASDVAEPSLALGGGRGAGAGAGAGAGGGLPKIRARNGKAVRVTTTKGGRVRGRSGSLPPPKTPVKRLAHVAIATRRMQRGRASKRHNRRASADDSSGARYKVEGSRRGRSSERSTSSRKMRSRSQTRASARLKFARLTGA